MASLHTMILWAVAGSTGVCALLSPDWGPILVGGLSLSAILLFLWRDGRELMLVPILYQWTEVAVQPVLSAVRSRPLRELAELGAPLESGAILGFLGLALLAGGLAAGSSIRLGEAGAPPFMRRLRLEVSQWPRAAVVRLALISIGAGYGLRMLSSLAGSAREPLLQLADIKYLGLFALFYWCLAHRRDYHLLVAVLAFEIVSGMVGFFAEFRLSLIVFFVALVAARPRWRGRDLAIGAAAAVAFLALGVVWTAIKEDYRQFVSHGTGNQVVLEPLDRRLDFLADRITNLEEPELSRGFDALLARHSYIEFISLAMRHVPRFVPHESGGQTMAALRHISMPRVLFPNKPPLRGDTSVTAQYTGLNRFNNSRSTSISIGYLGEFYIDFGYGGALAACLLFGAAVGAAFAFVRDHLSQSVLLAAGASMTLLLPLAGFGTSLAKLVGDVTFSLIAAFLILQVAAPLLLRLSISRSA